MPALTIASPTDIRSTSPSDNTAPSTERDSTRSRSDSPDRPPVSPITPTVSVAQLAKVEPIDSNEQHHALPMPGATFRKPPAAVPISESDNPDAIALRSAISLLQLQREKSKRDLKALQELKSAAVSDPQGFARAIQAQSKQASHAPVDILSPTLSNPGLSSSGGTAGAEQNGKERKDSAGFDSQIPGDATSKFPQIPQPQNIVRCPPVNWAKYNIVGEPLDKMHEEQRRWPGASEPPRTHNGARAPPHAVASPYSPLIDGISDRNATQPSKGMKKPPS